MIANQPYNRYSQIDPETAAYICLVANVEDVRDISLMDINTFMTDMEEWYKDVQISSDCNTGVILDSSIHYVHTITTRIRLMNELETYCEVYDFTSIRSYILEEKGEWSMEDQVRVDMLEEGLNPHSIEDVHSYWKDILKNYGG